MSVDLVFQFLGEQWVLVAALAATLAMLPWKSRRKDALGMNSSVQGGFESMLLLRAIVSEKMKKTSRKFMSERVPHVQNSRKGHKILAASPPILRAGFSSFGRVELARS